jgi:hypothetical protein
MTKLYMAKLTNGIIDNISLWDDLKTALSFDSSLVQVSIMAGSGMTLENIPEIPFDDEQGNNLENEGP